MDPHLPQPSSAGLHAPLLQPGVTGPPSYGGIRPGFAPGPVLPPGGITVGKILFDSKDKPRDDSTARKRGFGDRPPSPVPETRAASRPKKRVRERDQDLDSDDSDNSEAEREKERERVELEEGRKRAEEERKAAEEKRLREEEERRVERERMEREALEKMVPTQTIVVKGISVRASEEDVARCLSDYGPLPISSVRIIRDRMTKISRGFAFVDLASVKLAKKLMEDTKTQKLLLDGRKLHFEYTRMSEKAEEEVQDWVCPSCTAANFARNRTCFKCSALRTADAKIAEPGAAQEAFLKQLDDEKTDNLIVRGLEPDVDEPALHYTFAKFGPIKELRVIRDRNTLMSRGFAFVHFNTAEEAKAALLGTNNMRLDKTGPTLLRVAFARPQPQRPPPAFPMQSAAASLPGVNNLVAGSTWQPKEFGGKKPDAALATWEPKEFGMSEEERKAKDEQAKAVVAEAAVGSPKTQSVPQIQLKPETQAKTQPQTGTQTQPEAQTQNQAKPQTQLQNQVIANQAQTQPQRGGMESLAVQLQQEALSKGQAGPAQGQPEKPAPGTGPSAGFVWDEASGYYYDAATGYYYDGHKGLYYNGHTKVWYSFDTATQSYKEVQPDGTPVSSAAPPAATAGATLAWTQSPQQQQLPQAAPQQPASDGPQPATSSLQPFPQRPPQHANSQPQPFFSPQQTQPQTQAAYGQPQPNLSQNPSSYNQIPPTYNAPQVPQNANRPAPFAAPQFAGGNVSAPPAQQNAPPSGMGGYNNMPPAYNNPRPAYNQAGWQNAPQNFPGGQNMQQPPNQQRPQNPPGMNQFPQQQFGGPEPMARGAFVLGGPGGVGTDISTGFGNGGSIDGFNRGGGEGYRDRAAERRGLYGVPPPVVRNNGGADRGGYGRQEPPLADEPPVAFERVDQSRAIGSQNVGNRMLRNMGWQEGQGLGRGGGGMVDPIKAERTHERAGLGVEAPKVDPQFEILPGDSYKVQMQKKAQQRFMMEQKRGTF